MEFDIFGTKVEFYLNEEYVLINDFKLENVHITRIGNNELVHVAVIENQTINSVKSEIADKNKEIKVRGVELSPKTLH